MTQDCGHHFFDREDWFGQCFQVLLALVTAKRQEAYTVEEKKQMNQILFVNCFEETQNDGSKVEVDPPHPVFLWKRIHERLLPNPAHDSVSTKHYR